MKKFWQKIKKIFKKFQSYSAWVSLSAAIVLLVTALGKAFGFSVENEVIENVVLSVAGVLVVLGLVSAPLSDDDTDEGTNQESSSENENLENKNLKNENEENENDDE